MAKTLGARNLTDKDRRNFRLLQSSGLTYMDISNITGRSDATVRRVLGKQNAKVVNLRTAVKKMQMEPGRVELVTFKRKTDWAAVALVLSSLAALLAWSYVGLRVFGVL